MTAQVIKLGDLVAKLDGLADRSSKKAITAGVRAGMTSIAKSMRSAINASDVSSEVKRQARKSIGSRFRKARGGTRKGLREAKVGFAVGKKLSKATGGGSSRGVGLSARNVHWFVLGTKDRHHKSGHYTGRIDADLGEVTEKAVASSQGASLAAASRKIRDVLHREAKKRRV